jgi:hypothetical protein
VHGACAHALHACDAVMDAAIRASRERLGGAPEKNFAKDC